MKILQVGKFYYPYHGGIETVVKLLSEELVELNHQVTVLCASPNSKGEEVLINGVKVIRLPNLINLFSQPILPTAFFELRRLIQRHDIIQVHSPNPLLEFLTLLASPSIPVIVTYHSDIIRQKILLAAYRPFLLTFLNQVNKIIAPTERSIEFSPFLNQFQEKCEVIPYGVDSSQYNLIKTPSKIDGEYFIFIGRLVPYKGVRYLLEAMKTVSAKCLVIGNGPLKDSLYTQVQHDDLEEKVTFLERVDCSTELFQLIKNSIGLILPSITPNEAFGMVQLEAMHCSIPVITTSIPSGVPSVGIPNKTTLLVNPESSIELAAAMNRLLHDKELRTKLGQSGKERAMALYTKEKMAQSYSQLYEEVFSRKKTLKKAS